MWLRNEESVLGEKDSFVLQRCRICARCAPISAVYNSVLECPSPAVFAWLEQSKCIVDPLTHVATCNVHSTGGCMLKRVNLNYNHFTAPHAWGFSYLCKLLWSMRANICCGSWLTITTCLVDAATVQFSVQVEACTRWLKKRAFSVSLLRNGGEQEA